MQPIADSPAAMNADLLKQVARNRALDAAIEAVHEGSMRYMNTSYAERAMLVRNLIPRAVAAAEEWVNLSCAAKGIDSRSPMSGEEWLAGPVVTVRNMRLLAESLEALDAERQPFAHLPQRKRADGKCETDVFPTSRLDAALFKGFTATVVLDSEEPRFGYYRSMPEQGRLGTPICVVLGAGNVSSIPAMDVLHKVFVEGKPCVLKLNPVNEYLAPVFEQVFGPLIEYGIVRIVCGGADVGTHLCNHRLAGEVHVTGSDATHDAIVWGPPGPEREARKQNDLPVLKIPITSELGNVSPVIVVPGRYNAWELVSMAKTVVSMVTNNASFNCNAAKMIVTSRNWEQRDQFLRLIRGMFRHIPPRKAYYPGAHQRYKSLLTAKGRKNENVSFGGRENIKVGSGVLPWTLIAGLDPNDRSEPLFRTEPFCTIVSETVIDAPDEFEFMLMAADFCNNRLWGTLNACIMISPESQIDDMVDLALEGLIDNLNYGTVAVNQPPWLGYGFVSPPWGGAPGATIKNPQSGIGWVHNTYMLGHIRKVVIKAPLVMMPKAAWQYDNRTAHKLGRKLVEFEAEPSWLKLPGIVWSALGG